MIIIIAGLVAFQRLCLSFGFRRFLAHPVKPNRTKQIIGIVIGSLLLVFSPIVARILYLFGMQRAFETLGSGPGIADPNRLSGDISAVLYACAGGLFGSVIGFIILIVSIILFIRAGRRLSTTNAIPNATGNA